jgi:prepilin-type N-terminal cleavage/methylation domain-containing protein/prepilin-type processing-associated H-X9-DG protein
MYKKKAFTLIELLVVISIIALLIAILMPALNKAREQATGTVCLGNQKALVMAYLMYADENEDRVVGAETQVTNGLPPYTPLTPKTYAWVDMPSQADLPTATVEDKKDAIRRGHLWPYLDAIDVFHCPGDRRELGPKVTFRSYSIPYGLSAFVYGYPEKWAVTPAKKLSQIKRPSSKYVFVEESDPRGINGGIWVVYPQKEERYWVDPLAIWHNNRSTLGFADGHAEMMTWVDGSTSEMSRSQPFWYPVPEWEGSDLDYMKRGYPYGKIGVVTINRVN